ncbi:D4Ertd196e protein, putative [Trichomonas vaginalis G3]|uniref:D4Ertd196e protein, putative n=1 Tax=Trichomonas vaginalis (strain ATCC PRA-98 / G3) TaxID=412133 RepID=A2DV62_TRIV3|nr:protein of unknown function, DUF778 [Trichomonas vaginalis G3]EAY15658.1 D4Ertd196e protein, putative [Trichomonas vaginalis G3]KAI5504488.1 protein of unknown function, DUF778 [Trichomonas vaginalis G3]|eukprot:XP_001327881.1 D4Ertd196e protein [Trichomonas vaginalis G3]
MDIENFYEKDIRTSIVWTQIPILSWLCPALGHVGVVDSHGVVFDFQGPRSVGRGRMLFGDPMQCWKLDVDTDIFDNAILQAEEEFHHKNYSLLCSNCHLFAACVLEKCNYPVPCCCFGRWTHCATIKIIQGLVIHGRSINICRSLLPWIGFIIIYGLIVILILFAKGIIP